jgi:hypothetical protein
MNSLSTAMKAAGVKSATVKYQRNDRDKNGFDAQEYLLDDSLYIVDNR